MPDVGCRAITVESKGHGARHWHHMVLDRHGHNNKVHGAEAGDRCGKDGFHDDR
jgi:hypothetical protein